MIMKRVKWGEVGVSYNAIKDPLILLQTQIEEGVGVLSQNRVALTIEQAKRMITDIEINIQLAQNYGR